MKRCETCLRPLETGLVCQQADCSRQDPEKVENLARKLLISRGYFRRSEALWYVANDDEDNFQEQRISGWTGTLTDAYRMLQRHDFPQSDLIMCGICKVNPAEFFGDDCYDCALEKADWFAAERAEARATEQEF